MGFYGEHILPRLVNAACGMKTVEPLRRRVCEGLAGEVVEIGFGSGLNVPFYPAAVTRVAAVEPADLGWKLAEKRLMETRIQVQRSGLDGQSLPFPENTFDAALSTWTLCTIPDAAAALAELRRVLKPGGTFHFVEHGLAPDEPVRRWQRRLDPMEKRLFGGCHFTRPIVELVTGAGFTIKEVDVFYEDGAPKFAGADSLGIAVSGLARARTHRDPTRRWGLSGCAELTACGTYRRVKSDRADVLCLRALGALRDVELHTLVLVERAVALSRNGREVHENVGAAAVLCDETEALFAVEPLHCALSHVCSFCGADTGPARLPIPGLPR